MGNLNSILLIILNSLYGDNEELLAKWFKRTGKRDQIFLATKFGFVKGSETYEVDSSGAYCKEACAESLRLLGIDSIDICKQPKSEAILPFILVCGYGLADIISKTTCIMPIQRHLLKKQCEPWWS